MGKTRDDTGFTIIEVIVAVVVIGLFAALFFQSYVTNTRQQANVIQRAAADDIAVNNLKKVTKRSSPLLNQSSVACDTSTNASTNTNNLIVRPTAPGSPIQSVAADAAPEVGKFVREPVSGTPLPADTTSTPTSTTGTKQTMVVLYPRGCAATEPIQIKTTVRYYTSNGEESVTRAVYIN